MTLTKDSVFAVKFVGMCCQAQLIRFFGTEFASKCQMISFLVEGISFEVFYSFPDGN